MACPFLGVASVLITNGVNYIDGSGNVTSVVSTHLDDVANFLVGLRCLVLLPAFRPLMTTVPQTGHKSLPSFELLHPCVYTSDRCFCHLVLWPKPVTVVMAHRWSNHANEIKTFFAHLYRLTFSWRWFSLPQFLSLRAQHYASIGSSNEDCAAVVRVSVS